MTDRDFKVVAIVAAFNEADIIAQVVKDLLRQEVLVYVIDNGSTDRTRELLSPLLDEGLLAIEPFPPPIETGSGRYDWKRSSGAKRRWQPSSTRTGSFIMTPTSFARARGRISIWRNRSARLTRSATTQSIMSC